MRAGYTKDAHDVAQRLLATAEHYDWRLPELLSGDDTLPVPVPYPVACSPQAWSAGAPLLLLRSVLRLEPDVPGGIVNCSPVLPRDLSLTVAGIPLGDGYLGIRWHGGALEVIDCPAELKVSGVDR
jgi:glycogen debranching enzyme